MESTVEVSINGVMLLPSEVHRVSLGYILKYRPPFGSLVFIDEYLRSPVPSLTRTCVPMSGLSRFVRV
jgi:hypothetical protein